MNLVGVLGPRLDWWTDSSDSPYLPPFQTKRAPILLATWTECIPRLCHGREHILAYQDMCDDALYL